MNRGFGNRALTESQADYLEAVLRLSEGDAGARVTDIADALQVRKPSVTAALKILSKRGMVRYGAYSRVELTGTGKGLAEEVSCFHRRLKELLMGRLGLSPGRADLNACRMEHALDPDIMEKLLALLEK